MNTVEPLYLRDTSIQGTPNLIQKNVHIIFVTSIEGWTLFLGPETRTPFRDTLLKKHHLLISLKFSVHLSQW